MQLALALLALAAPAPPAQPATLALHAPKATAYGHRIDFAGRVSPSAPGTTVRLYRGSRFVTSTQIRGDGSFRMQVAVASPGPFVARWQQVASPPVTVRIVPVLETSVVGTPVVGAKLRLQARLRPAAAGPLRVRVVRGGRKTLDQLFYGPADVELGTDRRGDVGVLVRSLPRPGFAAASRALHLAIAPPRLAVGSQNPAVLDLTHQLRALHYAVPPASSSFSWELVDSVYAFEKVQGLDRTGVVDSSFWTRLVDPREPAPRYTQPADHIEVDKAHQVLYIVRGGQIALIVPVSTAGIPGYYTPTGRFAIYRKVTGWDPSPLGVLYDPMYFVAGYAIHGNPSVPPYPASHGCVRVPMWIIPRLFVSEPFGEIVYVY